MHCQSSRNRGFLHGRPSRRTRGLSGTNRARSRTRCEALVEGLGNEAFNWKPEERRWSICECLDHLNITAELYLPFIDRSACKESLPRAIGRRPRAAWSDRRVDCSVLRSPAQRPRQGPQGVSSQSGTAFGQRRPQVHGAPEPGWSERLRQANGVDLWRTKIRSPAIALLRLSLGETFALDNGPREASPLAGRTG